MVSRSVGVSLMLMGAKEKRRDIGKLMLAIGVGGPAGVTPITPPPCPDEVGEAAR